MKLITFLVVFIFTLCFKANAYKLNAGVDYYGFRHIHSKDNHKALKYLEGKSIQVISKGRVNVYKLKDNIKYQQLPPFVKKYFFPIKISDLKNPIARKDKNKKKTPKEKRIAKKLSQISEQKFKDYLSSIIAHGPRNINAVATNFITQEFTKLGIQDISSSFNIVATIPGTSEKSLVIIGHMDTVRNTVGADDNASGTAGVLEIARAVTSELKGKAPKLTLHFVISEDEEIGLVGAKKFVEQMIQEDKAKDIKFAINMDMIAHNSNQVIDLETNQKNKPLAENFATLVHTYTDLTPNLVLNPWGSDHMPFLDKDIPAILTLENWEDHTPCWHKACDTIETLNFEYATKILQVNFAAILNEII